MLATYLGWILTISLKIPTPQVKNSWLLSVSSEVSNEHLSKFWEIEDIQHFKVMRENEKVWELNFATTDAPGEEGKFILQIPFRQKRTWVILLNVPSNLLFPKNADFIKARTMMNFLVT